EEKKRRRRLRAMARIAARVAHDTAVMNAFLDSPEGQEWLAELSTGPEPSRLRGQEKRPGANPQPKPAPGRGRLSRARDQGEPCATPTDCRACRCRPSCGKRAGYRPP